MDKRKKVDPSNKDCAYCETSGAKLTCGKCKAAHYCSQACQRQHWKNGHKEKCIAPDKSLGLARVLGVGGGWRQPSYATTGA